MAGLPLLTITDITNLLLTSTRVDGNIFIRNTIPSEPCECCKTLVVSTRQVRRTCYSEYLFFLYCQTKGVNPHPGLGNNIELSCISFCYTFYKGKGTANSTCGKNNRTSIKDLIEKAFTSCFYLHTYSIHTYSGLNPK